MLPLKLLQQHDIDALVTPRSGEQKIAQSITLASSIPALFETNGQTDCRFALIGVPEDIGPRANLGYSGATGGWQAFLQYFLNLQANDYLPATDILLVGEVDCTDLLANESDSTDTLREKCAQLDDRVHQVLVELFAMGLVPIVIGGGHNNAFPIIKACSEVTTLPLAVANLDPHSDFRELEGRHSGNPFRYAHEQGLISHYAVLGLHEQKNNSASLAALKANDFPWYSIQQTHWSNTHNYDQCLEQVAKYLLETGLPIGIEVDLDAISEMPSSAMTFAGLTLKDALYYVDQMASLPHSKYLHLAEAAPLRHAQGEKEGKRVVGQALAELVSTFVKSFNRED